MSSILYEKRGAVGHLWLNRPDKLNAVNAQMLDMLEEHLETAAKDADVRALVLSGEGRAFSAGFDIDMGDAQDGESDDDFVAREMRRNFAVITKFLNFPKPIVAAVHGYCLGSAMEVSAVCDITIAAEGCRFGAPEVRFGSGIVCMILPWIIGQKNAREMLLVGSDKIDAGRAEAIGLINRVVAEDELLPQAFALADEISLNDPLAVQLTKKALLNSLNIAGLNQALENALEIDIEIETTETPESAEFNRILDAEGAKAALAWRAGQFRTSTSGSMS
jgi:enoyl-CoA hydratase